MSKMVKFRWKYPLFFFYFSTLEASIPTPIQKNEICRFSAKIWQIKTKNRWISWKVIGKKGNRFKVENCNNYTRILNKDGCTNNKIERWHNGMRSSVKQSKPSFWKWFSKLNSEQGHTEGEIVKIRAKVPAPPPIKKVLTAEER